MIDSNTPPKAFCTLVEVSEEIEIDISAETLHEDGWHHKTECEATRADWTAEVREAAAHSATLEELQAALETICHTYEKDTPT